MYNAHGSAFRNYDKEILDVVLEDSHQTEVLGATPEHPFYISDRGWVPAGELRPGDQVVSHASGEGRDGVLLVKAVNARPEREDTYNFEVADNPYILCWQAAGTPLRA